MLFCWVGCAHQWAIRWAQPTPYACFWTVPKILGNRCHSTKKSISLPHGVTTIQLYHGELFRAGGILGDQQRLSAPLKNRGPSGSSKLGSMQTHDGRQRLVFSFSKEKSPGASRPSVSSSTGRLPEVTKSGTTSKPAVTRLFPITPARCPEGTLGAILKQAGIESDDFLNLS